MSIDFFMGVVCLLCFEFVVISVIVFFLDIKQRFRNHKPVTSPTPPPSPQSYWTGKPVVPESIRKSNQNKCPQCPNK